MSNLKPGLSEQEIVDRAEEHRLREEIFYAMIGRVVVTLAYTVFFGLIGWGIWMMSQPLGPVKP